VQTVRDAALARGQLAIVTEGGYDLPALAECLQASIDIAEGGTVEAIGGRAARGERAIAAVRPALKPFWRAI
jgi:hypothetical protein